MAVKQVYVPVGFRGLVAWTQGERSLPPGWGVAPDLHGVSDAEEVEQRHYDALWVAAETPEAQSLPAGTAGLGRVVVFTVEVDASVPENANGVVDLPEPLADQAVVCAHAQDEAARLDEELLWFDATELASLAGQHPTV